MKKFLLILLALVTAAAFAACSKPVIVSTALGDFECDEKVMDSIEGIGGNSLTAAQGNVLLVLYLTPAKGNDVTMDQAGAFFFNGSKVTVNGETYDLSCIAYEQSAGTIKYGLVFEIRDDGYSDSKLPIVSFTPPSALPTPKPAPTPAPTSAPEQTPVPTTES